MINHTICLLVFPFCSCFKLYHKIFRARTVAFLCFPCLMYHLLKSHAWPDFTSKLGSRYLNSSLHFSIMGSTHGKKTHNLVHFQLCAYHPRSRSKLMDLDRWHSWNVTFLLARIWPLCYHTEQVISPRHAHVSTLTGVYNAFLTATGRYCLCRKTITNRWCNDTQGLFKTHKQVTRWLVAPEHLLYSIWQFAHS